jgi:Mg2+ and Co2+ transporter CorA
MAGSERVVAEELAQGGYPFALVLIVLTTVLPLIWFKWKDWI